MMPILTDEQKKEIKKMFLKYKNNGEYPLKPPIPYKDRKIQTAFCNFFRSLIEVVCEAEETNLSDFNALLVISNAKTKGSTLLEKINSLNISDDQKKNYIDIAKELIGKEIGGYVGYPMSTLNKELDIGYLKELLLNFIQEKNEVKQRGLIDQIDLTKLKGFWPTYLPSWLHYINPSLFPIVAKVNQHILKRYGLDNDLKLYPKVIDLFKEILTEVGESDMGLLDSFFYPPKAFSGFTNEDFEDLDKINNINENQDYWGGKEYVDKEMEKTAKTLCNKVKRKFTEFKDALKINFLEHMKQDVSRVRAQGLQYKSLFWIYYINPDKGSKDSQVQLQISIHKDRFFSGEIWFEEPAKEDMDVLANFLLSNDISLPGFNFRVFDPVTKKDIYNKEVNSSNKSQFIDYLKSHKYKLGIVSEKTKEEVISSKGEIIEQSQSDLEVVYETFYKNLFENKGNLPGNNEAKQITVSKNRILYGPPGTGKTFITKERAVRLIENG